MRQLAVLAAALWLAGPAQAAELSPQASLRLTDRNGRPMRAYLTGGAARAEPVNLEEISPWLILATITAEDRRFFTHPGVDLKSVARALWQNTKKGRTVSGASTITQQLARALKPRRKSFLGKAGEMFSALRLESGHSKDEILEGYLNSVSYGNFTSGAQAAARTYYGIPARALTLAQAAGLAGIPKSPVLYDPVRRPREFLARQRLILRKLLELGYVDGETYRLALNEPLAVRLEKQPFEAPHFCAYALANCAGRSGGLRTTLDLSVQSAAAGALSNHLAALDRRYNVRNGAVVVLDNATGGVLAWVGSNNFFDASFGQVDGVISPRQPGSALKPFLYALAFSKGAKASDLIADEPLYAAGGYTPLNYDKKYHGKVRLREALACSYNIPAVRLAEKTGTAAFLDFLRLAGFKSLDKPASFYGAGLALGNGEVKLLELASAYSALARGGIRLPAVFEAGRPIRGATRVMHRNEAYLVTDILSDNSARAAAFGLDSPLNLPFAFAAKTGTTKDYRDNWAVGYTPQWTIGVWVGNSDGSAMRKISGITGAAPVLREVALRMKELYGSTPFYQPPQLRAARVCTESGLLPAAPCPSSIEELFLPGALPSGICALHGAATEQAEAAAKGAAVSYPIEGDIFSIDPNTPLAAQAIVLKASVDDTQAVWRVDSRELPVRGPRVVWPLAPGKHSTSFSILRSGNMLRSKPVHFTVLR